MGGLFQGCHHSFKQFVGPGLGRNCLHRFSADDTNRQKVDFLQAGQFCRFLGRNYNASLELRKT